MQHIFEFKESLIDEKSAEQCGVSDLELGVLLGWVFEAQCETLVTAGDIRQPKSRSCNRSEVGTAQFLSLFYKDWVVEYKEMETKELRQVMQVAIGMESYCQFDEQVSHMFLLYLRTTGILLDSRIS